MKNTRTKIQLLILAVTVILSVTAFMYLARCGGCTMEQCRSNKLLAKALGGSNSACQQPYSYSILEWIF